MLYQMKSWMKQIRIRPGMKWKRKRRLNLWELASEAELNWKREREIQVEKKG